MESTKLIQTVEEIDFIGLHSIDVPKIINKIERCRFKYNIKRQLKISFTYEPKLFDSLLINSYFIHFIDDNLWEIQANQIKYFAEVERDFKNLIHFRTGDSIVSDEEINDYADDLSLFFLQNWRVYSIFIIMNLYSNFQNPCSFSTSMK